MSQNSFGLSPALLWAIFGKGLGEMDLKVTFRIMQAKSLLRTNVLKAIQKVRKAGKSSVGLYYQAKFSIALIKFQKTASDSNFQQIFNLLNDFYLGKGVSQEYQVKVFYMQAELSFMTKSYQ
jgi:hypothetical protein